MTVKVLRVFSALFFVLALASCNGASGDNDIDDGADPVVASLSVEVFDANCDAVAGNAFTLGESICVRATLSGNGAPIAGEIISFEAGIGELSAATKLSDSNGVAQITLSSTNANIGAASLNATFGEVSALVNYEFLSATSVIPELSTIAPVSENAWFAISPLE